MGFNLGFKGLMSIVLLVVAVLVVVARVIPGQHYIVGIYFTPDNYSK